VDGVAPDDDNSIIGAPTKQKSSKDSFDKSLGAILKVSPPKKTKD
jgi:hypothetical protein